MIDRGVRCAVTLALTAAVMVLTGCGKKQEPPAPPPAPTQTSDAAKEAQPQAAEATKDSQAVPGFDSKVFLATLDKNGDSKITREEYGAIWKDKSVAERNFKMIDRNGDGVLTGDEFKPAGMPK